MKLNTKLDESQKIIFSSERFKYFNEEVTVNKREFERLKKIEDRIIYKSKRRWMLFDIIVGFGLLYVVDDFVSQYDMYVKPPWWY